MDAPAAISAVYTDYRRVKGRKVHQITLEIPSEMWPQAYAFLGEPSIETSAWYALAKLVPEVLSTDSGAVNNLRTTPERPGSEPEKRRITQLHGGSQAALVCKREAFWKFLRETRGSPIEGEEDAAIFVRLFCAVKSRSEIETSPKARERWHLLYSAFDAWIRAPA